MFLKCIHWSLRKVRQLLDATQACSRSPTNVQNSHNIGHNCAHHSIIRTIITSHKGIAYHVKHNAQGTPLHHDFNPLISVECAYVELLSLSVLYSLTCLSDCLCRNLCVSPKSQISRSQVIYNYELEIVHNCLDMAVTSLLYHCKYITKFILLLRKSAVGS